MSHGASETATKKNPALWEKAKSEAKSQLGGKWSARAAQLAVQKYKSKGGKYEGKKSGKTGLEKWTKQEWQTRPGTPDKAEREGVTHRYLPKAKWESLSKSEQKATDRKKVEASKQGKQVVPNTEAARVQEKKEHGMVHPHHTMGVRHGYSDEDEADDNAHEFKGHGISNKWISKMVGHVAYDPHWGGSPDYTAHIEKLKMGGKHSKKMAKKYSHLHKVMNPEG